MNFLIFVTIFLMFEIVIGGDNHKGKNVVNTNSSLPITTVSSNRRESIRRFMERREKQGNDQNNPESSHNPHELNLLEQFEASAFKDELQKLYEDGKNGTFHLTDKNGIKYTPSKETLQHVKNLNKRLQKD
ncbi:hypothetical protein Mgra_00004991 [Meloidogyne graminicola]|uniref:Uncharacterized protein n=1 Tax=Meloidogyne graminicola TaxID=189291 RepID=A0A8S9ZQU0_9BILA|nr:hypothetical protein Mgra_00004991 [Meloidogyne graminicola]